MGGIKLPAFRIDQSLSSRKLIPTIPGERGVVNIRREKQLEDEAAWQQWKIKWGGTFPEFLIFRELLRLSLKPGEDFEFQSSQFGGRSQLGGAIVDFVLFTGIAGRVQGEFFHFRTASNRIASLIQRIQLEGAGFIVVDMLASEIEQTPRRIASMLVQGQETPNAQTKGRST